MPNTDFTKAFPVAAKAASEAAPAVAEVAKKSLGGWDFLVNGVKNFRSGVRTGTETLGNAAIAGGVGAVNGAGYAAGAPFHAAGFAARHWGKGLAGLAGLGALAVGYRKLTAPPSVDASASPLVSAPELVGQQQALMDFAAANPAVAQSMFAGPQDFRLAQNENPAMAQINASTVDYANRGVQGPAVAAGRGV